MRILIVTSTYPPQSNGQATFSGHLAEGLAALGHQVAVLLPARGWKLRVEQHNGVTLYKVPSLPFSPWHPELIWPLRLRGAVLKTFGTFQPDLVHLQDSSPLCQATMAEARRRGLPVLVTHHPGPEIWAPYFSWLARFFRPIVAWFAWTWMRLFLNRVDGIVTPSQAAAQVLLQHGVRVPVRAISCGVNWHELSGHVVDWQETRRALGLALDRPLFVYVGRLDPEKRLPMLLQAVEELKDRPFQLALAGSGGMEYWLRHWVDKRGLGDKVRFLGQVAHDRLGALLQAADVFVMPGDVESLSLATLEAMACGKPVVAARAMALPELVRHGENGLLFHPGDASDLARQMAWMLDHPERWAAMGARGRELARDHDLSHTLAHYEHLYEDMVQRARRVQVVPVLRLRRMPLLRALAVLLVVLIAMLLGDVYHAPAASASGLSARELRVAVIQRLERLFEKNPASSDASAVSPLTWQASLQPVRIALFARGEGQDCPPLVLEWPPFLEQPSPASSPAQPTGPLLIVESDWDRKALHALWRPEGCTQDSLAPPENAEGQRLLETYGEQACQPAPPRDDLEALRCSLQVLEAWMRSEP